MTGFFERELSYNEAGMLVMRGPMDGQKGNGYHCSENRAEHKKDEPRGTVCGLRRGLSDAHGVDKSVRYEEEQFHVYLMVVGGNGSRNGMVRTESAGLWCISWNECLPERWQAHTLI
jgi:hypothetical protein